MREETNKMTILLADEYIDVNDVQHLLTVFSGNDLKKLKYGITFEVDGEPKECIALDNGTFVYQSEGDNVRTKNFVEVLNYLL